MKQNSSPVTRDRRPILLKRLLYFLATIPILIIAGFASSRLSFLGELGSFIGLAPEWTPALRALAFVAISLVACYVAKLPQLDDARLFYTLVVFRAASGSLHTIHAGFRRLPEFWGPVGAVLAVVVVPIGCFGVRIHMEIRHADRLLNDAAVYLNDSSIDNNEPMRSREIVRQVDEEFPIARLIYPSIQTFLQALDTLHPDAAVVDSDAYLDRVRLALKMLEGTGPPNTLEDYLAFGLRAKLLFWTYQKTEDPKYLRELESLLRPFFAGGLALKPERWQTSGRRAARELVHNLLAGLHLYWAIEYPDYKNSHSTADGGAWPEPEELIDRAHRYLVEASGFEDLSPRAEHRICNNFGDLLLCRVALALAAEPTGTLPARGAILVRHRREIRDRVRALELLLRQRPSRVYCTTLTQLICLSLVDTLAALDAFDDNQSPEFGRLSAQLSEDCAALLRYSGMAIALGTSAEELLGDSGPLELRLILDLAAGKPLKHATINALLGLCRSHLEQLRLG